MRSRTSYKPRTKQREVLGVAKIIDRVVRRFTTDVLGTLTTDEEAMVDGFESVSAMLLWMLKTHGHRPLIEPVNKLTLEWLKPKRVVYLLDGKPQVAEVGGRPWGYAGDIARDEGGHERLRVIEVLEWEKDERPSQ